MTLDYILDKYGISPTTDQFPEIRELLLVESMKRANANSDVLRLLCMYLFVSRDTSDILRIWNAKSSSMDAMASIDVHFCGAGLEETKAFLATQFTGDALNALEWIRQCEKADDYRGFSFDRWLELSRCYYGKYDDDRTV